MKQAAENNDPPGNSEVEGVTWMSIYLPWPIRELRKSKKHRNVRWHYSYHNLLQNILEISKITAPS